MERIETADCNTEENNSRNRINSPTIVIFKYFNRQALKVQVSWNFKYK